MAYNATVGTLDSAVQSVPVDQPVIIITASYEGRPCENAKQFVAYLESKPKLNVTYGVFGAGHHDWVNHFIRRSRFILIKQSKSVEAKELSNVVKVMLLVTFFCGHSTVGKRISFESYEKMSMDKM